MGVIVWRLNGVIWRGDEGMVGGRGDERGKQCLGWSGRGDACLPSLQPISSPPILSLDSYICVLYISAISGFDSVAG